MKTATEKPKRSVFKIGLGAALLAVAWLGWHNWQGAGASSGAAHGKRGGGIVVVSAAQAERGDMAVYLTALGSVVPENTVTVHSRVDGELQRLNFSEGQMVRAGQLLAQLDGRAYQAQLTQAQGQLARDQAALENARTDLVRYKTLLDQNSGSRQQYDTQLAQVRQDEGTVKYDQGVVANARVQLDYTRIVAPVGGRVGLKQVDLGNIVHASDTSGIVVITQVQPSNVVFALPENQIDAVLKAMHGGKPLSVEAWDRDNSRIVASGTLSTLDNQVSSSTGTVNLKARFANSDNALFPNQFVNARLRLDVLHGVTLIPQVAVQHGRPGNYVYVVGADQTVSLRVLKLGAASGDKVVVESGLAAGERVVLDGIDQLKDGARVRVVDRQREGEASGGPAAAHDGGKGHGKGGPGRHREASGAKGQA
ncbi:MdtA/MuxA family multidrug efflux RND transporter periplasmic adaptor subunit [Paludibacterium yongneupense]|uniref:MdtA/MuxA family multidrug efflux RND transporter periplasmic adaptor subunit n=1 Tax=Paludibacterium yongneupense TaxID=400061 RepID=UPI0003F8F696|nr:MdtA/MuxA family multidrug efflux RND transporter periplasmic adaptor subunit [Paludibacterium yongneupense]